MKCDVARQASDDHGSRRWLEESAMSSIVVYSAVIDMEFIHIIV